LIFGQTEDEVRMSAVTFKPYPLGWKAKIGILLPAQDTGYGSYEFRLLCPDGVVTLETRVAGGKLTMDTLRRMRESALYGAELLAAAGPDIITYEATAAGFILGVEGDKALIKEIQDKTGIKATTGATAVSESLRFLGVKEMVIYAATHEEITLKSVRYLEDLGFKVRDQVSLGEESLANINRITPWELHSNVMKLVKRCPGIDGIFLSGGCFRTLEITEILEKDSGLPVVTTAPANMWHCLRILGIKDRVYGFGQLMEKPR
jgi:maleate isomerase